MCPNAPEPVFVAVTFKEAACIPPGRPHAPGNVYVRISSAPNGPPPPNGFKLLRVSKSRHGVTPMKGSGDVDAATSTASTPTPLRSPRLSIARPGGLQNAGAGQLAIFPARADKSGRSCPRARETEKTSA